MMTPVSLEVGLILVATAAILCVLAVIALLLLIPVIIQAYFNNSPKSSHIKLPLPSFFLVSPALVVSGLRDGIIVIGNTNRIIYINQAAVTILNKSAREIQNKPVVIALDGSQALIDCIEKYQQEEIVEPVFLSTGSGGRWYEVQINAMKAWSGGFIGRLVLLHDITKRVQAQNSTLQSQLLLKQSEEKYRSLVENINEVIYTIDASGIITFISPIVQHYTGFTPDEVIGRSYREFVFPDDLYQLQSSLGEIMKGYGSIIEFRILDRESKIRIVRSYSRVVVQDGVVTGVQGVLNDVTERKQVEEALERHASQLAMLNYIGEQVTAEIELGSVIDSAARLIQKQFGYYHVAIFTPDPQHEHLIMRTAYGAFSDLFPHNHQLRFGQGMVGWAAKHHSVLLSNDVRLEPRYTNLYPDKILTRSELAVPILVGEKLVGMLDVQSPLVDAFDDNDVRVIKTVADQIAIAMENARLYSEVRSQLEELEKTRAELEQRATELETANASLRQLDRLKSQFLANMSHELRTPLNSIIGFSEVLYDQLSGPINDEQKEYLQDIMASGSHLLSLINDLLDFSKLEAGRMALEPSTFAIQPLFDELRMTILPLTEKKSQTLNFTPCDDLLQLNADRIRIKQVLINLLSNANKFTNDAGTITVTCRMDGEDHLLFLVSDTGIGIRAEDQSIIFEEFRQVDGTMTRRVPGSGLGLSISKRIIEMHRGRIWVESVPGQGSTFFVCLPIRYSQ